MSPYFQVYGIQLQLPSDFSLGSHVEDNSQREETRVLTRLAATQISTLKAVQKRHDQNQKQYARKVKVKYYKPGTLVDVWRPYDVKGADRSRKFTCYWSGPYKVLEHNYNRPHQVRIGLAEGEDQWQRPVHVDHVRRHGKTYFMPKWKIPGGWDSTMEDCWSPVAPPYDQHKTRQGEYERQLTHHNALKTENFHKKNINIPSNPNLLAFWNLPANFDHFRDFINN